MDELDHASIIEGHRLSFSTKLKFKHNDMDSLEKQLQKCEPDKVKLIVIDGVFSMEGDVAKLPEIVALAKKYNASEWLTRLMVSVYSVIMAAVLVITSALRTMLI